MTKNLDSIKKMVKHIVRHDKGITETRRIYPAREWGIGLMVCSLVILLAGITSASLFVHYSNDHALPTVAEATVPYKAALVAKALDRYRTLQSHYEALTKGTVLLTSATSTSTSDDIGTNPVSTATTTMAPLTTTSTPKTSDTTPVAAPNLVF